MTKLICNQVGIDLEDHAIKLGFVNDCFIREFYTFCDIMTVHVLLGSFVRYAVMTCLRRCGLGSFV